MCVLVGDRAHPDRVIERTGTGHGGSSMRLERRYTQAGKSPFAGMAFRAADSEIRNPDGSVVFSMKGIDVPAEWSPVAADVLAQKYFRRAGVPARLAKVAEHDVPQWLWRSAPDEAALNPYANHAATT